MNARELESYHIYRKVQAFLDHWAALFFAINASALRTSFDALVEQLAMFVAKQHQQEHVRRGGANHVAVLRTRLVEDHIDPIIATGLSGIRDPSRSSTAR